MNCKKQLVLFFGWMAVALAPTHPAFAADVRQEVTITGRVNNTATGANLEGVVVRLDQTNYFAVTDREGNYRLQVPAGNYTLVASYTGLEGQSITLSGSAGETLRRDIGLTAEIYKLSPVTVSGEREGNALAITLQRQASNVKNIVAADAFGSLAGNPADLARRLAGVVVDSEGFGDFRYVRIRGISHQLITVTMDGNRMADAASGGATREFQFQSINSDALERLELVKSPTPDMDADSVGGAVNMVSKTAFDRAAGRRVNFSVGSIWRPFDDRDRNHPNFSVGYSEVFGEKKNFGVTFNYAWRQHLVALEQNNKNPQPIDTDPAFVSQLSITDNRNRRTRWGGNLRLDYKLTERSRFFSNISINRHAEHTNNVNFTWGTNTTVATRDASGNLTGTGGIVPGYTSTTTEWRPVQATFARSAGTSDNKNSQIKHYQVGGVHKFDRLDIDYDGYFSDAMVVYPRAGALQITARNIGLRLDQTGDPNRPRISQTSGPDMFDINNYLENQLTDETRIGLDEYIGAAINARKDFATPYPTFVKAGLRIREQTRERHRPDTRWTYVGPDGVMGRNAATGVNDDNLAQFLNNVYDYRITGSHPRLPLMTYPFRDKKDSTDDYYGFNPGTHLANRPEQFREDIPYRVQNDLTSKQNFQETISAAYVMGNVNYKKLTVMGGFRFEKTETEGEGAKNEITPAEAARRAAWVGVVTDAEAERRIRAQFGTRIKNQGSYQDVYPGIHFKFEPIRGLVTRASWSTSIGRPAISSLIPREDVNHISRTVGTNNPGLMPQFADNFDVNVEYYFEPVGMLSVGAFHKKINDFIFTQTTTIGSGANNGFNGEYEGYILSNSANGGYAKIKGLEFSYQQQFTFLPGWLQGFGAFANYTRLATEGNYGTATVSGTSEVAGFVPESINLGLSYNRKGMSIRLQHNYRGKYLGSFNSNPANRTWRAAASMLDIKTVFPIWRRYEFYFDVANIFEEPDRNDLRGNALRPLSLYTLSPQFSFGVNGRF